MILAAHFAVTFLLRIFDILDPIGMSFKRSHSRLEIPHIPESDLRVIGARGEHARVQESHVVHAVRVRVVNRLKIKSVEKDGKRKL